MTLRDDMAERFFHILETAVRSGFCTREDAQRYFSAVEFLQYSERSKKILVRLGEVKTLRMSTRRWAEK